MSKTDELSNLTIWASDKTDLKGDLILKLIAKDLAQVPTGRIRPVDETRFLMTAKIGSGSPKAGYVQTDKSSVTNFEWRGIESTGSGLQDVILLNDLLKPESMGYIYFYGNSQQIYIKTTEIRVVSQMNFIRRIQGYTESFEQIISTQTQDLKTYVHYRLRLVGINGSLILMLWATKESKTG